MEKEKFLCLSVGSVFVGVKRTYPYEKPQLCERLVVGVSKASSQRG